MDAQDKRLDNFIKAWSNKGSEVADKVTYWNELLSILGVPEKELADGTYIEYEKKINWKSNKFHGAIDGYIPKTKVLIEQKSFGVDLAKPESRPNGGDKELITPFRQAKRYDDNLPANEKADYYVLSNFSEIWIYDIRESLDVKPVKLRLSELKKQLHVLDFLVKKDTTNEPLEKEKEVSLAAGELVSKMYNELSSIFKKHPEIDSDEAQRSINTLCVRLVFCLYAEDAKLFGKNTEAFHDYLEPIAPNGMGLALKRLFRILDMDDKARTDEDPFLKDDNPELAKFPYVNGGMFHDQSIVIPPFTPELKDILLNKASRGFDWSDISPTIFGAVFESTLNPETRRQGGMHYTSVENIHKVIDPLFLDDLKAELQKIKDTYVQPAALKEHARKFQEKLANLTFLDPACGSGNFLTETYLSLRKLENEAIKMQYPNPTLDVGQSKDIIKVSIQQFYGIEINDFAVSVAKTALWIAESQMMDKTKNIFYANWDFLPLKTYTHIHEGNALRMDWNHTINDDPTKPNITVNYIMGNPPFKGYSSQNKQQKEDLRGLRPFKTIRNIDYVSGWYFKALEYIQNTSTQIAFVSTNSITQGEQVVSIWQNLRKYFDFKINFAYSTFEWSSEAKGTATVAVVIIGLSNTKNAWKIKYLFKDKHKIAAKNINFYLLPSDDVFVVKHRQPLNADLTLTKGNQPTDHGYFILSKTEANSIIKKDPRTKKFIHPFISSREFLYGKSRYCFWLVNASPKELKNIPEIRSRIEKVKQFRLKSSKKATRRDANTPYLFQEIRQKTNLNSKYLAIPVTTSETRKYIPIGFLDNEIIASNALLIAINATKYDFGIIESIVHMAWMRVVTGRLEMRYQYSNTLVYNNFPWPNPTQEQKDKISKTAQAILNARAQYPDSSLADLYDPLTMPPELLKAHQANDRAVMQAYGFKADMTESEIVAELFKMYERLVSK